MGEVYFYHLTRQPLEAVLPTLLDRARGAGWRVVVRGQTDQRMDWLDEKLWQGGDDQFMPHGRAGGAHDAQQPILLTTGVALPNGATCLMSVDGAGVDSAEVQALARVCILFDGNDPAALNVARGQWRALTDADCKAKYWSQEGGPWQKKAES